MSELTPVQEAFAMQALYDAIGREVKAGGEGLRGRVDREMRANYESMGAKSYAVSAEGTKLGTYTVTVEAATPSRTETVLDLVDGQLFDDWLMRTTDGADLAVAYAMEHGEAFARWALEEQGVVPPGTEAREVVTPAKPERYKGGRILLDKDFKARVARQVAESLPALVAPRERLIGGGV